MTQTQSDRVLAGFAADQILEIPAYIREGRDPTPDELRGPVLSPDNAAFIRERLPDFSAAIKRCTQSISTVFLGQNYALDTTMICAVAGGNILIEGGFGLAKTLLAGSIGSVLNLQTGRIQFTADLMPSDILGLHALFTNAAGEKEFHLMKGPIFSQLLHADEINRAGPKVQSAMMEAMQEKQVTLNGKTYRLQRPFFVIATQNPTEEEGTYPLPGAQEDRFMMKQTVTYPKEWAERMVMVHTTGTKVNLSELHRRSLAGEDLTMDVDTDAKTVLRSELGAGDNLILIQKTARALTLPDHLVDKVIKLVRATRPREVGSLDIVNANVETGAGPRAYQAFALAAKARALIDGRTVPDMTDIHAVFDNILQHRIKMVPGHQSSFAELKHELTRKFF